MNSLLIFVSTSHCFILFGLVTGFSRSSPPGLASSTVPFVVLVEQDG